MTTHANNQAGRRDGVHFRDSMWVGFDLPKRLANTAQVTRAYARDRPALLSGLN
jgi:hypothetical protein